MRSSEVVLPGPFLMSPEGQFSTSLDTRVDDGQPGIGDHSKDPPGFEPGEGGREGVGDVSKDFGELSDGAQGAHARDVGEQMGISPAPRP